MAYRFDGVDDVINFGVGALSAQLAGPCTMAVCVNLSATTDGAAIHLLTSGDASGAFLEVFGNWDFGIGATARAGPAGATGSWRVIVFSKASGTASVEWTQIILGGATTSGTASGGTLANGSTPPGGTGKIRVGRFQASATEYLAGDIAATAVWSTALDQTAREALSTWDAWLAATPAWAVEYTESSSRSDATGGGGDESSRTGTTLVADPSGFFDEEPTEVTLTAAGTLGALSGTATTAVSDSKSAAGTLGALSGTAAVDVSDSKSAAGTLGALSGTAAVAASDSKSASGTLGALSGTAALTVSEAPPDEVTLTAAGTLGALTGTAALTVSEPLEVMLTASGTLGGLSGSASLTRADPASPRGGGWVDYLAIVRENDAYMRAAATGRDVPVACPRDGEPLQQGPGGVLRCPFDGYRYDPRGVSAAPVAATG